MVVKATFKIHHIRMIFHILQEIRYGQAIYKNMSKKTQTNLYFSLVNFIMLFLCSILFRSATVLRTQRIQISDIHISSLLSRKFSFHFFYSLFSSYESCLTFKKSQIHTLSQELEHYNKNDDTKKLHTKKQKH